MQPDANKIHNLIVLGGGGVRGVLSCQALNYIERYTGTPLYRLFQGAYGTSTGAIQALAVSSPNGGSATVIEKAYETLAGVVFQKRLLSLNGFAGPLYESGPLENQLRNFFGNHALREAVIPTGVVTYNLTSREPEMWCSYGMKASQPAWAAARASSAAPTFFAPYQGYIDGGLCANLPSGWAALDYSRTFGVPLDRIRVLAIGTGTTEAPIKQSDAAGRGKLGWVADVIDIGMSGAQDLEEMLCKALGLAGYLQLQINIPPEAAAMDDASPVNLLRLKQLGNQMVGQKLREVNEFLDAVRGATGLPKVA